METQTQQRQREAERLRRAHAGDPEALADLYEAHVDGLWAFVFYRVGRDPAICEDVVSETFLDAIEHGDRYDAARGSLRTWLCQRSRNIIRKHRRTLSRDRELAETWERVDATLAQLFQSLDREPLSDELLAREETRELVNVTIANLPSDYRDALERKYLRGESLREVAAGFALSEAAAKSLLSRARRAFRDAFSALAEAFEVTDARPETQEAEHVRA